MTVFALEISRYTAIRQSLDAGLWLSTLHRIISFVSVVSDGSDLLFFRIQSIIVRTYTYTSNISNNAIY